MKKMGTIFFTIVAMLVLGGCATGGLNGMDTDPKRMVIVVCTDGPCKPEQRALAGDLLIEAAKVVETEMSGPAETGASRGFANAFASAVATALTIANPLGGTVMAVSAVDSASQGAIEGLSIFSYAKIYAVATIADLYREDRIKQKVSGYEIMEYLHIVPAFTKAVTSMEEFRRGK